MQSQTSYESYLNSMKNYQTTQGRIEYQEPFAEDFEAIYNKAKEQEIGLSDARNFLETLSSSEVKTLQKYSGLADSINIDSLSAEGAYNLLLHDNEQYDFDSDGVAEVGIGKRKLAVPINMPKDVRDAYISAMNSLSDKEKLMSMTLTFDSAYLLSKINNEPYTPTNMDYSFLKNRVESMLNPTDGGFTSEETKATIQTFWDAFNSAYTGDTAENEIKNDAVSEFLKELRTKGAAGYLADLNKEKIEKLVDEYKEKLLKEMGDSPEALQEIAKLVEDYKKQLLEEMREKSENEKMNAGEQTSMVSKNSTVAMFLQMQQEKQTKPLQELLSKTEE